MSPPASAALRLNALRAWMAAEGLTAFFLPHGDAFQNEFLPAAAERLAWLTGFTGSAGEAVILADRAALFIDGRYTLQAAAQVDPSLFTCHHLVDEPAVRWLETVLTSGARLGYDPWQVTPDARDRLRRACVARGAALVACPDNPVDLLWHDRPPLPASPLRPHAVTWAGRDSAAKRQDIAAELRTHGQAAVVLAAPDSVAWLLNLRGTDVPHTPLALVRAVMDAEGKVDLFVDPARLSDEMQAHLGPSVRCRPPEALGAALDALGEAGQVVRVDRGRTPAWILDRLEEAGARTEKGEDPCLLPKACKNPVELEGARAAHRRDGLALTRFLHWLSETVPGGGVSECAAAERLAALRAEDPMFIDLSFPTISATGPHAAIVHYRATPATDRILAMDDLYLVDSGAQYPDGTTDVTRTVALGPQSTRVRRCYTLVLRGHIALARAHFPQGTVGSQLDTLARQYLWRGGMDYDHGTGHGVGSFLGVHEGPARINKTANAVALLPGMILSNEPGYYHKGAFGIRIESLIAVHQPPPAWEGAARPFLCFETLTLVPLDRTLIETALLQPEEQMWINTYHARVYETHEPWLSGPARAWLAKATAPL